MPPVTRAMVKKTGLPLNDFAVNNPALTPLPIVREEELPEKKPKNEKKDEYEEKRKNHVPRFLFRAWHRGSGGGSTISINTVEEIVPPAFKDKSARAFYDMKDEEILEMARAHFNVKETPVTGFSSWAASLHLVIHYAKFMVLYRGYSNVHVACIDISALDNVLVWHVPHLMNGKHNEEYMAYGIISGKGYQAVKLSELSKHGIDKIFPGGIQSNKFFGPSEREKVWLLPAEPITPITLQSVKSIASLFGPLSAPMALALITMRPRFTGDPPEFLLEDIKGLLRRLTPLPPSVSNQWLKEGNVDTSEFPDVKQWIDLYRALIKDK